jgi:hypothetical protein
LIIGRGKDGRKSAGKRIFRFVVAGYPHPRYTKYTVVRKEWGSMYI